MNSVDDGVAQFLAAAAAAPQLDHDVPRFRAAMAGHLRHAGSRRPLAQVVDTSTDTSDGPLRLRVYRPDADSRPVLVYLHGGAFVRGDLETADVACREIAARAPAVVVSVDYRLAPEHPYPAAVDDARRALDWVAAKISSHGGDPRAISIGGDSAGANIATVVAADTAVTLRAQLLLSGVFDLVDDLADVGPEVREHVDVQADARRLAWIARLYAGRADPTDARLSPLRDRKTAGPPALVMTSALDPFAAQSRRLAAQLRAAATPVELVEITGMPHGFCNLAGLFPARAGQVYELAATVLRDGVRPGDW